MPKKDPVTGCDVMTVVEFWQNEAKGSGRTAGELFHEFYDEMNRSFEEEASQIKNDLKGTQITLARHIREWNESDPDMDQIPALHELLEVTEIEVRQHERHLTARYRDADGAVYILRLDESTYPGSRLDPPDYDFNLRCEKEP
jgi:hypothetical protein